MKILKRVEVKPEEGEPYYVNIVRTPAAEVYMIDSMSSPKRTMAKLTLGYTGLYNPFPLTSKDQKDALVDLGRTKLQTPLEMIYIVWLINNVSRAFTHQIVRYRIGTAFIQESMRFFGLHSRYNILATKLQEENLDEYTEGCVRAVKSYHTLLQRGVADQDARGVLPTNILTHLYFGCSLRTLQSIIPQRMCCQAQPGEWQGVMKSMRSQIGEFMGAEVEELLQAPYERGEDCGYRASFDRPCIWKNREA